MLPSHSNDARGWRLPGGSSPRQTRQSSATANDRAERSDQDAGIDDRLDRVEFAESRGEFGKALEPSETEFERLERELSEVLGSIVSIDRLLRSGTEVDEAEESSFRKVLAMLRRRQAGILFRMGSRAGNDGRALEAF